MKPLPFLRIALVTAAFLLIPFIGMLSSGEMKWTLFDFVFATVLVGGVQLAYALVSRKMKNSSYKLGSGLALMGMFLLVWVNGAVGIIGDEGNDINMMYFAVIAIIFFGAIISRFKPEPMVRVMCAAAIAQMLVPVIAFAIMRPVVYEAPGLFGVVVLNAVFAMIFAGSGMLFGQAAHTRSLNA